MSRSEPRQHPPAPIYRFELECRLPYEPASKRGLAFTKQHVGPCFPRIGEQLGFAKSDPANPDRYLEELYLKITHIEHHPNWAGSPIITLDFTDDDYHDFEDVKALFNADPNVEIWGV